MDLEIWNTRTFVTQGKNLKLRNFIIFTIGMVKIVGTKVAETQKKKSFRNNLRIPQGASLACTCLFLYKPNSISLLPGGKTVPTRLPRLVEQKFQFKLR